MPTPSSPLKYDAPPRQTPNPSNNADHHSFPPLQSQSEIGRKYPVGPVTGIRKSLFRRLKNLLLSGTQR